MHEVEATSRQGPAPAAAPAPAPEPEIDSGTCCFAIDKLEHMFYYGMRIRPPLGVFRFKELLMSGIQSLLYSRKFWLAVFGIIQAVVLNYFSVPEEIWQSITVLVGVLIASIAIEDAGEKSATPPQG